MERENNLKQLKINIGYKCNLKCGFCLVQEREKEPTFTIEMLDKILSEPFIKKNVESFTITGGEPTAPEYLDLTLQMVDLISNYGKKSVIFTNGTLLTDDVLDKFKSVGLTRFRVSLYDPFSWGDISKMFERLRLHNFPVFVKYTVTKKNYRNVDELLQILPYLNAEWLQIKPYNRTEIKDCDKKYELSAKQVLQLSKTLTEYRRKNKEMRIDLLPLCYDFLVEDTDIEKLSICNCGKGNSGYLVIEPSGDIKICGAYKNPIGNVNQNEIGVIWETHNSLKEIRNLHLRPIPVECGKCNHWDKCSITDCHSATFNRFGNYNHGNPQCPIVKKFLEA